MKDRVFYDQSPHQHQSTLGAWRSHRQVRFHIPAGVRSWLLDEGSLTEHLVRAADGDFRVSVQRQDWRLPHRSEQLALGMEAREVGMLRETLLLVKGQPWVYARSVIPATSLAGANRCLRALGNRSLGSWLFRAPDMQRSPFEVALLQPGHSPVPAELQGDQALWGRRSRFQVNDRPLLVCEIFLPSFEAWPTIAQP